MGELPDTRAATAEARPDGSAARSGELADIVRRASGGDEEAWCVLVRWYGRRLFALAKSRLRDADLAEEVVQSVFAKVATTLRSPGGSRYEERGSFEPWLFRVTMNRIRDEIRRGRRGPRFDAAVDTDGLDGSVAGRIGPGVGASTGDASLRREQDETAAELTRLRAALARLSGADREVIELRHHGGMAFAEMSALLGQPVGTLLARHHRALRKLRDMMAAESTADSTAGSAEEPARASGRRAAAETRAKETRA